MCGNDERGDWLAQRLSCAALETYDREGMTHLMWAVRFRLPLTVRALCARAAHVPESIPGEHRLLDLEARERLQLFREPCRLLQARLPPLGMTAAEMQQAGAFNGRPSGEDRHSCARALLAALDHHRSVYGPAARAIVVNVGRDHWAPVFPRELATLICGYAALDGDSPQTAAVKPKRPTRNERHRRKIHKARAARAASS
jgi:hypothetical protein